MRLLFVDGCISQRGPESRTQRLAYAFLEEYEKTHPDAYVTMCRVDKMGLKPLTAEDLDRRDAQAAAGDFSGGDFERPESLGVLYWKQLCAMFGIPRFDYVFAGGLDVDPEQAPEIMRTARKQARRFGRDF